MTPERIFSPGLLSASILLVALVIAGSPSGAWADDIDVELRPLAKEDPLL